MVWSRAWAFRELARVHPDAAWRDRFAAAYAAHVEAGVAQRARWKDDYRAYGHWVGQFAVYALTAGEAEAVRDR